MSDIELFYFCDCGYKLTIEKQLRDINTKEKCFHCGKIMKRKSISGKNFIKHMMELPHEKTKEDMTEIIKEKGDDKCQSKRKKRK